MRKIKGLRFGVGIACLVVVASLTGCDNFEKNLGKIVNGKIFDKKSASIPMDLAAEKSTAAELTRWIAYNGNDRQIDLQRDRRDSQAFEKLKGRMVIFKGKVREVGITADKELYVSLTVGMISMVERMNIQFNLPDSAKSTVSAWKKGETHVLRGRVEKMGNDLEDDVVCEDSEVVSIEAFDKDASSAPSGK